MKSITLHLMACFFATTTALVQPPRVPATKGTLFGSAVKKEGAVSPDMLPDLLKEKASAEVTIKGQAMNVCKARGCFLYMKTATGKIYIKTKDDTFFVPVALNGKTVVVQGTASKEKEGKTISIQATGILVM